MLQYRQRVVPRVLPGLFLLFSWTAPAVEFNTDVLDTTDKRNIDFSRFSQAGYLLPGVYPMQVHINGQGLGNEVDVPFYVRAGNGTPDTALPEACVSPALLDRLGLTEAARQQVGTWHQGQCADFTALKGTVLQGDVGHGTLNINLPQAWLEYSDATWMPPSRWDNGIPGLLLDYNLNGNVTQAQHHGQQQSAAVSGMAGANLGAWRLRAGYQGNYAHTTGGADATRRDLEVNRVYLYRPLPALQATLTLGESDTGGSVLAPWRYTGVKLVSEESMLPPHLRNYAPEIIGVANTNARVTVRRQGQVVYDSTVPAGPFRIQDLDSGLRGQLDVTVTEQNGAVQTFSVSTATLPYLTRPGQVRYAVAAGRPGGEGHRLEGPAFVTGDASWGLSNAWSVFGGSVLSDGYQALALGVGRDLYAFGSASLDVTQSRAWLPGQGRPMGKSWRFNYAKHFDEANTDVSFAGYRFAERHFLTLPQYLSARYHDDDSNHQKASYQLALSKRFDDTVLPLSLGINTAYQTYWDQGATTQYGLTAGTWFDLPALGLRNLTLSVTAARSHYLGREDDTVNLSLSVPMNGGSLSLNSDYSQHRFGQRLGYYGELDAQNNYSLSAGLAQEANRTTHSQFSGLYAHNGPLASLSASASLDEGRYTALGLNASGGLTVTAQGAALHAGGGQGGTRLMVDTDGVSGVPVDAGRVVTNRWGLGVLTNLSSYYRTTARVDVSAMGEDMEATQGVVETALTEGAIGYRRFTVLKGERLFAVLRLTDGSYPPFGASVRDERGRELGIVGDDGLAWLSGLTPGAALDVVWAGHRPCHARLPQALGPQQLLLPCGV